MSGNDTLNINLTWKDDEAATGVFIGGPVDDDPLNLLGLPSLSLPEVRRLPEDFELSDALKQWFDALEAALRQAASTGQTTVLEITSLDEISVQALGEILGEGEVSGQVSLDGVDYEITEALMAGVWHIHGSGGEQWVEVAPVPTIAQTAALSLQRAPFEVPLDVPGVMNGSSVLAEISERATSWIENSATANHVINFTLLPMNENDHALLTRVLGRADLELTSGGFGDCRVMATRYRHVWAVQYINAMGHTILDTIEIGAVPAAVAAAAQDMEDSISRLREILEAYL